MDSSNAVTVEPVPEGSKRAKTDNSDSEEVNGSSQVTPSPPCILNEDELRLIFNRHWISTNDLLSFRLVNKSWCDVATLILLRRDACSIAFDVNPLAYKGDAIERRIHSFFYKRGDQDNTRNQNMLSSLTALMSTSPKFPASTVRIQTSKLFITKYCEFPDLVMFFDLHGKQIKTLRLAGLVAQEHLLDIFVTYVPNLECLDLSEATLSEAISVEQYSTRTIPIQSLVMSNIYMPSEESTPHQVLHRLLSSPSKLSSIKNVKLSTLPVVLEHGKSHLIKSFCYKIPESVDNFETLAPAFFQFTAINPKLTKLTLAIYRIGPVAMLYEDAVLSLNAIIESSKDTLQELDLCVDPNERRTKLKIPPMKNLTSIVLRAAGGRNFHFGDDTQVPVIQNGLNGFIFGFEDGIIPPKKYFPSLVKISLKGPNKFQNWNIHETFLCLQKFLSNNDGSPQDKEFCGKVDTLEIHLSSTPYVSDAKLVAQLLPNIRFLKISCGSLQSLNHSLWVMCPLVEFIDIQGVSTKRWHTSSDKVHFYDKFFSGFSSDMCKKLQSRKLSQKTNHPDNMFKLLRVDPSVTDLKRLKVFNLKYSGEPGPLISHVTQNYVFSNMPNTKFNILYSPDAFTRREGHFEDQYGDKVFAYNQPTFVQNVCPSPRLSLPLENMAHRRSSLWHDP